MVRYKNIIFKRRALRGRFIDWGHGLGGGGGGGGAKCGGGGTE